MEIPSATYSCCGCHCTVWLWCNFNTYVHVIAALFVPERACVKCFGQMLFGGLFVRSHSLHSSLWSLLSKEKFNFNTLMTLLWPYEFLCVHLLLFSQLVTEEDETALHMFFLPWSPCHPLFPLSFLFFPFFFSHSPFLPGPMWKMRHHQNHRRSRPSLLK